jgi:thiamine kinase
MAENLPRANSEQHMSRRLSPDAALRMIPQLAAARWRWKALPGGLSNRSFKVDTGNESFVLRLDSGHTAELGLDRALETRVRVEAHKAGLGAAVIYADDGILLSEFLPGEVWRESDLENRDNLAALAALLRKVHALPETGKAFSAAQSARQYAAALSADSELRSFSSQCQELLAAIPVSETRGCCHNDIVTGNIVRHSDLKLLDWEYACDNDPMFDLASVIGFHDLDAAQTDTLFSAYTGGPDPATYVRLQNEIRRFDIIQWLWFATRYSVSPDAKTRLRLNELRSRITSGS